MSSQQGHAARTYKYDLVRAVAIIFVVAVHSMVFLDSSYRGGDYLRLAMQTLFFTGNALFFLLSGRFNLKRRSDDGQFKLYYFKKIRSILVPFVIIVFIRTCYDNPFALGGWELIKTFAKNLLFNYSNREYWFIYTLTGYLVVAPFLANIFAALTRKQKQAFLAIGLLYQAVQTLLANMGYQFAWGYLFNGFALVFTVGYFLEEIVPSKRFTLVRIDAIGVVCLACTAILMHLGYTAGMQDTSPLYTVLAIAIYLSLLKIGEHAKPNVVISFIAKHSFSVYLVHMMVLIPLQSIQALYFDGPISMLSFVIMTTIVLTGSLAVSFLLDSLVFGPVQRAFDALWKRLNKAR